MLILVFSESVIDYNIEIKVIKCVFKYKSKKMIVYCNKLKECLNYNTKSNGNIEENCHVIVSEFCTCRLSGKAVRS